MAKHIHIRNISERMFDALRARAAARLLSLIADAGAEMAAPEVFDLEVIQALRRAIRLG